MLPVRVQDPNYKYNRADHSDRDAGAGRSLLEEAALRQFRLICIRKFFFFGRCGCVRCNCVVVGPIVRSVVVVAVARSRKDCCGRRGGSVLSLVAVVVVVLTVVVTVVTGGCGGCAVLLPSVLFDREA